MGSEHLIVLKPQLGTKLYGMCNNIFCGCETRMLNAQLAAKNVEKCWKMLKNTHPKYCSSDKNAGSLFGIWRPNTAATRLPHGRFFTEMAELILIYINVRKNIEKTAFDQRNWALEQNKTKWF